MKAGQRLKCISHWTDEYIFIDQFPITRVGKVDYRELEEGAKKGENYE